MGSEQSHHQRDVRVDKQSVETTDFWTLYNGELLHPDVGGASKQSAASSGSLTATTMTTPVSMFQGEPVVAGQLWATTTPLDRATKNLMVYRHPAILKFLKSSQRGSQTILVTERCRPLAADLATQSDIQICLGLRSVLCALVFLVERAGARHLNVSVPVVYVSAAAGGAWRLAGFEQVWKREEVTVRLLELAQPFRSKQAVDSNEVKQGGVNVEQYAFGVLCEEVLRKRPAIGELATDFLTYCRTHLKHQQATARPQLSAILQHPYFNQDFVTVHSFLTELPLKSATEKLHFFTHLPDRLRRFDEHNVAAQLVDLLLSRMVLIDPTAQLCVLPHLLSTRSDSNALAFFTAGTFQRYVVPRILQLFAVRETQTRLILLEYFRYYVRCVEEADLRDRLLPQLLLGIKDTNDVLVAATLRALAELVPLLGAATVIGRNRAPIFADGRPQAARQMSHGGGGNQNSRAYDPSNSANDLATADLSAVAADWMEHRSITPVLLTTSRLANAGDANGGGGNIDHVVDLSDGGVSSAMLPALLQQMPERLSPDGGEDEKTASDVPDLENDAWSDWEADAEALVASATEDDDDDVAAVTPAFHAPPPVKGAAPVPPTSVIARKAADTPPEIDYFADMEPVIQKTNVLVLAEGDGKMTAAASDAAPSTAQSRLVLAQTDDAGSEEGGGWGNDVDGWTDS